MTRPPPLRFTADEVERAHEEHGFNCGPAALCAVLGLTIRQFTMLPSFCHFLDKGHTNPTLMNDLLAEHALRAGRIHDWRVVRAKGGQTDLPWPHFGLARIQWGGPWCSEGVPMQARYRQTHWVGCWREPEVRPGPLAAVHVFDVNAVWQTRTVLGIPGWLRLEEWARALVPQILESYPRASGEWWLTHAIEVRP